VKNYKLQITPQKKKKSNNLYSSALDTQLSHGYIASMGKFFLALGFALLLGFPTISIAEQQEDYNWQPKPNELLLKPVNLKCDGFVVIEAKNVKFDEKTINTLNLACQTSLIKFPQWQQKK